ncbi:hypothetical protein NBRC116494_28830 [Aurantivibrio plasticivorans]
MNFKLILAGTLAYTLVTFPLAVVWHILLFEEKYKVFGYFQGEPSFLLGFATIVIQGVVLSFLYPFVNFSGNGPIRGLKYSLLIGAFFWTSHVLAFVAKQIVQNPIGFVAMESFYLLLQFGIFGILIGFIFNKLSNPNA